MADQYTPSPSGFIQDFGRPAVRAAQREINQRGDGFAGRPALQELALDARVRP